MPGAEGTITAEDLEDGRLRALGSGGERLRVQGAGDRGLGF